MRYSNDAFSRVVTHDLAQGAYAAGKDIAFWLNAAVELFWMRALLSGNIKPLGLAVGTLFKTGVSAVNF